MPGVVVLALAALGTWDLLQTRHTILRLYPILGHVRFLVELIRPEIRQYFIESNTEASPFDRETRDLVYERAKAIKSDEPFGTERDVNAIGYEFLRHSIRARFADDLDPRVRLGGPDCTQPYDIALLNVSAMSFGALSGNAIEALNGGAARGDFAHDTGEGGISPYHLRGGGDLIWEIGSGYFGCRDADGRFDATVFAEKATMPAGEGHLDQTVARRQTRPGRGAAGREGQPGDRRCAWCPGGAHRGVAACPQRVLHTDGIRAVHRHAAPAVRRQAGRVQALHRRAHRVPLDLQGDPGDRNRTGLRHRRRLGGRHGSAPQEFEDHVGMPLTEALMLVHNALVGTGLRDRIRVGASGKVASGVDIVSRICQGADFTMSARAMMFAVGCIQAMKCNTNHCPTGVTTQDPARTRALDVPDKTIRVFNFQRATVASAAQIVASMGLAGFHELSPAMLNRRIEGQRTRTYAEIYEWLMPGELLEDPPESWRSDWIEASADEFR